MCWEPSAGLHEALVARPRCCTGTHAPPNPRHSVASAPCWAVSPGLGAGAWEQENSPVWERGAQAPLPGPTRTPGTALCPKPSTDMSLQLGHGARGQNGRLAPPRSAGASPGCLRTGLGGTFPPRHSLGPSPPPTHHLEGLLGRTAGRDPGLQASHSPESTPASTFHTEGACSPQPGLVGAGLQAHVMGPGVGDQGSLGSMGAGAGGGWGCGGQSPTAAVGGASPGLRLWRGLAFV